MKWGNEHMANDYQKELFLIKQAFKHLNSFKRYRALGESAGERGNSSEAERMELLQYKTIDQLELTLRGLQSELRKAETVTEDESE
jgi:hypothetical protein